jgi:hypothetical protein
MSSRRRMVRKCLEKLCFIPKVESSLATQINLALYYGFFSMRKENKKKDEGIHSKKTAEEEGKIMKEKITQLHCKKQILPISIFLLLFVEQV